MNMTVNPVSSNNAHGTARQANLSTRAMLANLAISQWTARKLDKDATAQVANENGAAPDVGAYHKRLVGKDAIAKIATAAGAARTSFYALTLPWLDDGARILPAGNFYRFRDAMDTARREFESAVDTFLREYDSAIDTARRDLGDLFKSTDYPDRAEVRRRFAFGFRILPFPDASDFRVDIGESQLDDIRREIESDCRSALDGAVKDAWQRIATVCGAMADRLSAYKPAAAPGDKAQGIFRDSLVQNVADLVELLPALNVTGDSAMTAICERMRVELTTFGAAELRDSDHARAKVAAEAKAILDEVSDYLA